MIYVEKKILNMHLFLLLVEIYEKETVTFRENGNLNIDTYFVYYMLCREYYLFVIIFNDK